MARWRGDPRVFQHPANQGRGIQRITRHPGNFAFALFGIGHMLSSPRVGDWIFFGGFVVYGIVSSMHQDRRDCRDDSSTDQKTVVAFRKNVLPCSERSPNSAVPRW